MGIFAACGGSFVEPSSDTNPIADGAVSETEPTSDAREPVADVSGPSPDDSGFIELDGRIDADANVQLSPRPSVDGGICATSNDCQPGFFCASWSDEYNASDNGRGCLPFPATCNTCGCAIGVVNAVTAPFHLGCYCFTSADSGAINLDPDATPVVDIYCSQA